MQTARRLYFYAVAFISLLVVLWSLISLIRSFVGGVGAEGNASRLAAGLSLILFGAPIFVLHAWWLQRAALKDPEERSSRLRALFLYGLLLATLLPVTQNALALVDRLLFQALEANDAYALLGANQNHADNLIAIAVNTLAALGVYSFLRADWRSGLPGNDYAEIRRIYRYFWLVYGLLLLVFGAQQTLSFVLNAGEWSLQSQGSTLANGIALLLVGLPVWLVASLLVQRSLADPAERDSLLRLVILYVIAFTSAAVGLIALVAFLDQVVIRLIEALMGDVIRNNIWAGALAGPLSFALPMAAVWFYYGRQLNRAIQASAQEAPEAGSEDLRRAGLRRLYLYVLALLGLALVFWGLVNLLLDIMEVVFNSRSYSTSLLYSQAASGISALIVGLPLWALIWRKMQKEAAAEGEAGDLARRSTVRKGYLFLVLFACMIGLMFSGGALFYQFFLALLGEAPDQLVGNVSQQATLLVLFLLFLAYHALVLRRDGRLAERSLGKRHAQFPLLILAPEDGGEFAEQMFGAVHRQSPQIPVAVHPYAQGVPDESLSAARAVILPAELASRPSEAYRLWLQAFQGVRLVIPFQVSGWHWVAFQDRGLPALARQAAQIVRQLAEGESPDQVRQSPGWQVLIYIFAGLFALQLLVGFLILVFALASN